MMLNRALNAIREAMNREGEAMNDVYVQVRGYKGAGFGSKFIQRWTRSEYSHVSLCFYLGHTEVEVEALQFKGVISHPPHSAKKKVFDVFDVPLNYMQVMGAHSLAMSLVGAKYDWMAIRAFVRHRKNHSLDKWICSETVAYVLLKNEYALSRRSPHLESPSTVCESLRLFRPPLR